MNHRRDLARITLIGIAAYILVNTVLTMLNVAVFLMHEMFRSPSSPNRLEMVALVGMLMQFVLAAAVMYVAYLKADSWAGRLTCEDETARAGASSPGFAFRLVSVAAGILLLYWLIPSVVATAQGYLRDWTAEAGDTQMFGGWPRRSFAWVFQAVLAVYLLCGAPHFVRWQVRKTLEQCGRVEGVSGVDGGGE